MPFVRYRPLQELSCLYIDYFFTAASPLRFSPQQNIPLTLSSGHLHGGPLDWAEMIAHCGFVSYFPDSP